MLALQITQKNLIKEETSFWTLAAFIGSLHGGTMRGLWSPGVPQLPLCIFQFSLLLGKHLPRLHSHFKHVGLSLDFFVSQWFLTLYSYTLPMHIVVQVWNVFITDG
jgi:hypothetical protein